MNQVIENIISRRSIRVYRPEQITEQQLKDVLKAAVYAPNGGNSQLWYFTALQNASILEKLNALVCEEFANLEVDENTYKSKISGKKASANPGYSFYYKAPTLVIASNDRSYPNAMADCAAAIENMLLAARSLGLGSCWINQLKWFGDSPGIREILEEIGVPKNHMICGAAALGYSGGTEPKAAPRKEGSVNIVR